MFLTLIALEKLTLIVGAAAAAAIAWTLVLIFAGVYLDER